MFTTVDRDNDLEDGNCASKNIGGWWYLECQECRLNGQYGPGFEHVFEAIRWRYFPMEEMNYFTYADMKVKPE